MPLPKSIRAEVTSMLWPGGRRVNLRAKIVDGPNNFLDRIVMVSITFEEINNLKEYMAEAVKRLAEDEARIARHTRDNCGEE